MEVSINACRQHSLPLVVPGTHDATAVSLLLVRSNSGIVDHGEVHDPVEDVVSERRSTSNSRHGRGMEGWECAVLAD